MSRVYYDRNRTTPMRCRLFGHRWGAWRYDEFYDKCHRPCTRPGCINGQMHDACWMLHDRTDYGAKVR